MSSKSSTDVRSPTSTKTATSTKANTTGNVTVTGGAGDGDTIVHIGTGGAPAGPEVRLREIKKMMTTNRKAYNNPKISGPEGEYQRLLKAYENIYGKPFK